MKFLPILLLFIAATAIADDVSHDDLVHFTAHAGSSFALQTIFYGFNKKALKENTIKSEGLALLETLAIGLIYKASEHAPLGETSVSMAENVIGCASAIATHVTFDF
jgi:hypothetical protein